MQYAVEGGAAPPPGMRRFPSYSCSVEGRTEGNLLLVEGSVVMGCVGGQVGPALLNLVLSNRSRAPLTIEWDRCSVTLGMDEQRAFRESVKYESRSSSFGRSFLGPGEFCAESVAPLGRVVWDPQTDSFRPRAARREDIRVAIAYREAVGGSVYFLVVAFKRGYVAA